MWLEHNRLQKACDTNIIIVKHMYTRNQVKGLTAPSCTRIDRRTTVFNTIEKAPDLLRHLDY